MVLSIVLPLFGCSLLYTTVLLYRRLFQSPIARFPGPKFAAATYWYEFYYDIICGGQYIWKVKSLHEQYGPIVRINPHELHVSDPDFWDVMYTASTNHNRRDKWSWQTEGIGIPASLLGTAPHALHRHRRSAINPFFSRQNVRKLLPLIEERVEALVQRLKISGRQGEIVRLEHAFSAFTNDVVMQYCFSRSDSHVEAPAFDPSFHKTSFAAAKSIALLKHMNWILQIMLMLPEWVAMKMGEEVSASIRLKRERITQIDGIRREGADKSENDNKTIFHTLLQSDLPEAEKATGRLAEEAVLLVGAGTHTGSWCLTVIAFHLLSNPILLRRLKEELASAYSKTDDKPSLQELEKLPFLTGVLKEGLRLGYGASARSARIAPDVSLTYGEWRIPPGTPVSMTIPLTHHDERVFPNSEVFDPDRWSKDSTNRLDKYLVSFSKGSRVCLGSNLAWAEMYLCVASIFNRYGSVDVQRPSDIGFLKLYDTNETDVTLASDMFFPATREGSKGVRVEIITK